MEKVNKIGKICLRVAGWVLLVLSVWAFIDTVIAALRALRDLANSSGSSGANAENMAYVVGVLIGAAIGFIIMLICSLMAIKVKKSAFAWAIVLLIFIIINAALGNGFGVWYQIIVRIIYIAAAFVVRFTNPK